MHIVIIGNGITGISTARYIRKLSDHKITVISAETKYFYSRTALMYIYMGHMKYENTKPYEDWFWPKNRIDLVHDYVESVDTEAKTLTLTKSAPISYDKLVIATGAKPNKWGWPGQDLDGVRGMYSMQDLEAIEKYTNGINRAVIVGGGLIGIEMAEMLHSRNIPVTLLVREGSFWNNVLPAEESALVTKHIYEHHFDLRLESELKEILPDTSGRVKSIVTKDGETIDCQFVGLTAGVSPNIGFIKDTAIETKRGVLINHYLETNIPDVYAAGDCAQFREPLPGRRPIEQVWYTGRMQGITLAHTLCGKRKKYQPRIWFNSAKFLDIEYHTYGTVFPKLQDGEAQFYWEHEDGKKCFKLVYRSDNQEVVGVNSFGFRMRHDVWEQWLSEKKDVKHVLENLRAANFDPEFFDDLETQIIQAYNQAYPHNTITLKKKRGLLKLIFG